MSQVNFPADGVTLQGFLHSATTGTPAPAAVVCHPHPLFGGSMENNVVVAVCQALAAAGIHALRFNFRGVGQSTGSYADGTGEQTDVRGALDYLNEQESVGTDRLGLCGYSFGGMVCAPVALKDQRVHALGLVSPAMDAAALKQLADFDRPLIVLGGEQDDLVTPALLQNNLDTPPVIVPGADHFWWGHETIMATALVDFFQASLQAR